MLKAISFDFYGVMYSNFDWGVINDRIYSHPDKLKQFQQLIKEANDGTIGNDGFRHQTSQLAEDHLFPGAPAVLIEPVINTALMKYVKQLKDQTDLKLAVLSNGGREHICGVLDKHKALKVFDLVATSAELPCYKPEPAAFEYVAEYFSIDKKQLLHVDDSPRHIQGAEDAGIQTLLYTDLNKLQQELEAFIS